MNDREKQLEVIRLAGEIRTATNVSQERALATAEAHLGIKSSNGIETPDELAMKKKLEDEHQLESRKLMRALGFEVVNFTQKRASKQTPGIPDTKYYHTSRGLTLWHEDKATWGTQSPAQKHFQEIAEACGEIYVLGTLHDLQAWLVENKIAFEEGGLLVPLPYARKEKSA